MEIILLICTLEYANLLISLNIWLLYLKANLAIIKIYFNALIKNK